MSKDFTDEEKSARFDAALAKILGITGPKVGVRKDGSVDVDFNTIEKRGKDKP